MRFAWLSFVLLIPTTASAQVVETARDVDVELRHGMALVTTRIVLENQSAEPTEVAMTLPTPRGIGLVALRVCSASECRDGRASVVSRIYETARAGRRFSTQPIAIAAATRGHGQLAGIRIEASPVVQGRRFELEVRYLAQSSEALGHVSFSLPPQVSELGSAPVRLALGAPGLELPTIDGRTGPIEVEPDAATVFGARLPRGTAEASAWSLRCGRQRCVRYRVAAGAVPATPRDVFLLLDVSPSVRTAEPEVRVDALRNFLGSLSPESRVTRVAYAREARLLDETPLAPADVPVDATLPTLGIRTLFETAWSTIREQVAAAHDPQIVIVGDGVIQRSPAATAALDELTRSGAQLSLVSLGPRDHRSEVLHAVTRTLGRTVEAHWEGAPLALQLLGAPVVDPDVRVGGRSYGALRAGETRVIERVEPGGPVGALRVFGRRIQAAAPRGSWATGLATRLQPDDHRAVLVAASRDQVEAAREGREAARGAGFSPRFARRRPYVITCRGCGGCYIMGSASRESLGRVRSHLHPAVRGCFARARRGRPSWSGRVTLSMIVRYGELEHVGVTQTTDPALAQCIMDATEQLEDIPFSPGRILINFPFRSAAVPAPGAEPLASHVDRALEAIGVRASPEP